MIVPICILFEKLCGYINRIQLFRNKFENYISADEPKLALDAVGD